MSTEEMSSEGQPQAEFSTDVGYFQKFIEALEETRDEGILTIKDDGVYSKVNDAANVMMCVARIQGKALNGLSVEGDEPISLGLNFEKTSDLLGSISKNSELVFTFPVVVSSRNDAKLDIIDEDLTFTTSTIDTDMVADPPRADPLAHSTQIRIDGSEIKKAVKHADKMVDSDEGAAVLGVDGDTFFIKSEDQVEGSFIKRFPQANKDLGEKSTKISLEYLKDIKDVLGGSESVTVHIEDENPIRFDADLDDEGNAQIVYLIAPRVEKEG